LKDKKKLDGHLVCGSCRFPSASSSSSSSTSVAEPLFERESLRDPLPLDQRAAIIAYWKDGQSREMIARKIGCSTNTIERWIEHSKNTDGSLNDKIRVGRKRKLDQDQDESIVTVAKTVKKITPRQIKGKLNLPVSSRTVRRRLNEAGLNGRIAKKQSKSLDQKKRLSFAEGYGPRFWSKLDWRHVLYSDEAHIELGPHGQMWVQRPPGKALDIDYMTTKEPHPPRLSVWGCFSSQGVGHLEIFEETLDAKMLVEIFKEHLVKSANRLIPPPTRKRNRWWLLQDNAPTHKAKLTQTWLAKNNIICLDFPPFSPDLNPIENLWNAKNSTDLNDLREWLEHEWQATNPAFLRELSDSMVRRCQEVVQNKGGKTKY